MKERIFYLMVLIAVALLGLVVFIAISDTADATTQQLDCNTFHNHSGFIPGSYDYANFYEDGFEPLLGVRTNGVNIQIDPPEGRRSWDTVEKCHDVVTTTTTVPETTTTTEATTTTTSAPTTTTTVVETTTTVVQTTTTVAPSTTSTEPPSTSTTVVTPTTRQDELPFTGLDSGALIVLGLGMLALGGVVLFINHDV